MDDAMRKEIQAMIDKTVGQLEDDLEDLQAQITAFADDIRYLERMQN